MDDRNNKSILAENIRHYMELNDKTRNDMCEALGVKYTTFADWVNAKTYPRIDRIEQIANYFGIEKSALMEKRNPLPAGAILYQDRPTQPIPIVGVVSCGTPLLAEDNIEGYHETFLQDMTTGETYFWLRAKGDSMINVGIHEGDLLLIRQQSDVDSGDIAVVAINEDDATLKRVIKKENALILQPENPAYETKIFIGEEMASVHIRGRLMKLEKRF
ncbi:MAG: helix-turn-helix domain-containing protein [Anaerotignum sp.]|nr:helix-turn-helix domain-containing protein [Anaerotignum sp.]MBR5816624.1 helix-turn-helix domain-containing protein [Anaerotignum sp.]MBR6542726.1 helix-turn-helix domain-containing protein [Anaerotignum sp.]